MDQTVLLEPKKFNATLQRFLKQACLGNYLAVKVDEGWLGILGTFSPKSEPMRNSLLSDDLVAQGLQAVRLGRPWAYFACNRDALLKKIMDSPLQPRWCRTPFPDTDPKHVMNHRGFSILNFRTRYYGIAHVLGSFDLRSRLCEGIEPEIESQLVIVEAALNNLVRKIDSNIQYNHPT